MKKPTRLSLNLKPQTPEGPLDSTTIIPVSKLLIFRCFPCWDEPALKATFDISLLVPKDRVALSNMPVKTQEGKGELVKYTFETTPIMSTYLVAAVIGEYDYVEATSSDGVLVRVYTPKGDLSSLESRHLE